MTRVSVVSLEASWTDFAAACTQAQMDLEGQALGVFSLAHLVTLAFISVEAYPCSSTCYGG